MIDVIAGSKSDSKIVEKVMSTSPDVLPEQRLPNAIARAKVQRLVSKRDELF